MRPSRSRSKSEFERPADEQIAVKVEDAIRFRNEVRQIDAYEGRRRRHDRSGKINLEQIGGGRRAGRPELEKFGVQEARRVPWNCIVLAGHGVKNNRPARLHRLLDRPGHKQSGNRHGLVEGASDMNGTHTSLERNRKRLAF